MRTKTSDLIVLAFTFLLSLAAATVQRLNLQSTVDVETCPYGCALGDRCGTQDECDAVTKFFTDIFGPIIVPLIELVGGIMLAVCCGLIFVIAVIIAICCCVCKKDNKSSNDYIAVEDQ